MREDSKPLFLLRQIVCDISQSVNEIRRVRREFEVGRKMLILENAVRWNFFVGVESWGVLVLLASTWLPGPLGRRWAGMR